MVGKSTHTGDLPHDAAKALKTPRSDKFIAEHAEGFFEEVRARLMRGRRDYGDASFSAPISKNIAQIREELADVVGWAGIAESQCRERNLPHICSDLAAISAEAVWLDMQVVEIQDLVNWIDGGAA